ncbi:MAG: cytochrome c peroxidase [Oligoflexia bacterium]|nr:cytochrome c peroxidase [Oligoflexia bacterium]
MQNFSIAIAAFVTAASALAFEALPPKAADPANNPSSSAKIELGKALYFDARLSKTGKVSCNSCHNVQGSGTDNKPVSEGVDGQKGARNAPTVWNAAFYPVQFWDGRAATLEDQAKGPMINPVEMGMPNHDAVVAAVSKIQGYHPLFKSAFGDEQINIDRIAQAIGAFERTLLTPSSPFDRYVQGDHKALSPAAQRGLNLVQKTGCLACHSGTNFSGPNLPTGSGFYMRFPALPSAALEAKYGFSKDLGRYEATHKDADKHMFRVQSWRNIELTAPYFHNGSVATLDEAVRVMAKLQLNKDLKDSEVHDIVAFLKSLTGKRPKIEAPQLPQ